MSNIPLESQAQAGFLPGGWLRNKNFDLNLIVLVSALAMVSGTAALALPGLFGVILVLDLWFLGYHHVVSTFTRLVFDRDSFQQNRFLVIQLPVIVILCTFGAIWALGWWVLPTVYLYWQWFHYTRQSYGLERMYCRSAPEGAMINDRAAKYALYMVPLFGILYRSYQADPRFLGMEVAYIPMSHPWLTPVLYVVGALTVIAFGYWLISLAISTSRGLTSGPHTLYLVSHHLIFATGYLLIPNITIGWLVINVWHNMQYIMFVWWFNNKRFKDQIDPEHEFLSRLSQRKSLGAYLFLCFAISSAVYLGLEYGYGFLGPERAITAILVTTMILNFHHYLVDGIIWKRKRMAPAKQAVA